MAHHIFIVTVFTFLLNGLCISSFNQQEATKTIKTTYGVYDCVDFYKQPTFSHPLLKNLTSKVIPNLAKLQGQNGGDFGLKDGCPIGTVPILRTNSNLDDFFSLPPSPSNGISVCVAVVHTTPDPFKKFYGVDGSISLYRPDVHDNNQWSCARVTLLHGFESIEIGWLVYPKRYKDSEAHLYVRFLNGKSVPTSTFVQVSKDIPLGLPVDQYSVPGNITYWNVSIDKHQDGNWWASIYGDKKYDIGYWPKQLFYNMVDFARQVEYGGEVGLTQKVTQGAEMGNGRRASYSINDSAFVAHVTAVDENSNNVVPRPTLKFKNCELYTVLDGGYKGDYLGEIMFFGGPWEY